MLRILRAPRPIETHDDHEFRVIGRSITRIGGIGTTILALLVSTLTRGDLRGSGFPGELIAWHSTGLRESLLRGFCQHRGDLLRSGLTDDAADRYRLGIDSIAIRIDTLLDDIRLHVDAAVGERRIGSGHLDEIHLDTLPERHGEEFRFRPFLMSFQGASMFAVQCQTGDLSESELLQILIE